MAKKRGKSGRAVEGTYEERPTGPRAGFMVAAATPTDGAWQPYAEEWEAETALGPRHVFAARPSGAPRGKGLGWLRDLPDIRDTTRLKLAPKPESRKEAEPKQKAFERVAKSLASAKALPKSVDNCEDCSPVEDQGDLGSCTAHAAAGMIEYMERHATGQHIDAARLFLYKVTRMLMGWEGDTGAYLRTTMKALVLFGMPPEQTWPYKITTFDREPSAFLYAYAANYKAIQYMRLDRPDLTPPETLKEIKTALAKRFVVMFGFSVYKSLGFDPDIPYPHATDKLDGGHAVLAVGYDDNRKCVGTNQRGALRIRNSWGADWGEQGYGWLPYAYVLDGLADDFWTAYQLKWVDTGKFD